MEDGNTPVGGPLLSAEVSSRSEGDTPSEKARIGGRKTSRGRDAGACRRVGNVRQRDDSDPYVAGGDYSELQSGRIVLQKQNW